MSRASRVLPLALVVLCSLPGRSAAEEERFLIVNPGGRGSQTKAQGFLADFEAALAAAWPPDAAPAPTWRGHYHVTAADALASIRGQRPLFALVTTGFYLAHRDDLGLVPVARPRRSGAGEPVVRFVCRAEDGATRRALEGGRVGGLRLGGRVAAEPEWVRRIVLAGASEVDGTRLVPVPRSLEAVRRLHRGELDVILLPDADWLRLVELRRGEGLVVAASSQVLPEGPVVAVGASEPARRDLAAAAARALQHFADHPSGRSVLERMTLGGFAPAAQSDYDAVVAAWDAPSAPAPGADPEDASDP